MDVRQLGRTDLKVAPWCFGGNVFGWTAEEQTSFGLLDAFRDHGFNFIDTADVYSTWVPGHQGGESERIIGQWLKQRGGRERVILATKVGSEMSPDRKGLSRHYIVSAVESSLARLGTDYIDLYQSHCDDPDTPPAETLEAYRSLVESGKVRVIGASNFSAVRLRESLRVSDGDQAPRYQSLQPEYNLYDRADFEAELQPLCLAETIGVIPYFSLASGFLTGKYRSPADFGKSARGGGMAKYLNARGQRILAALDQVAEASGATQAQIALAWLMAQPAVVAPIASATSIEQVDSLAGAAHLTLSGAWMDTLNQASRAGDD